MELCRLCYRKVVLGRDLFAKSKHKPGGIAKDVFYGLKVQIENKPDWPSMACKKCLYLIAKIATFRTQIEATQLLLAQIYDKKKESQSLPESTGPVIAPTSGIKQQLPGENYKGTEDKKEHQEDDNTDYSQLEMDVPIKQEWIEKTPLILGTDLEVPQVGMEEGTTSDHSTIGAGDSPTPDDNNYDNATDSEPEDELPPQIIEKSSRDLGNRPRMTRSAAKSKQDDRDSDFEIPLPKRKKFKGKIPIAEAAPMDETKKFKLIAKLNIKYPNREELETILRSLDILYCCICQDKHDSLPDLVRHVETVHKMSSYKAFVHCCNIKLELYKVYDHMKYHSNKTAFQCSTCKRNCLTKKCLYQHRLSVHTSEISPKFSCEKCGKGFHKAKAFEEHNELHLLNFECPQCQKPFQNHEQLLDHIDFEHNKIARHICDICGKGFNDSTQMKGHRKRHYLKKKKWEQCDECNLHFANVNHHKQLCHAATVQKQACEICGKEVSVKYLKKHISMVHDNERNNKCEICGKGLCSSTSLKAHMDLHQGIRHGCHFCSMTYGATSNRLKHMMSKHGPQYEEYKLARNRERAEKRNEAITNANNELDEN